MSVSNLQSWLKDNKLCKLLDRLSANDCEELDDLKAFDTEEEIEAYACELGCNTLLKKKFVKAVLKLMAESVEAPAQGQIVAPKIPAQSDPEPGSYQGQGSNDDEKDEKSEEQEGQIIVSPAQRVQYPPGVHSVDRLDLLNPNAKNRTIMMVGATGTGKTTTINSLMNYLWGVEFGDEWRFELIAESPTDEDGKEKGQTESQTDDVTAYYLNAPNLGYQLTIIDTPGFGDTRGLQQDHETTTKIKEFFQTEVQVVDAICFFARAHQARLTATQKYIFDQVLGIFGKDIADNILVLLPFADDSEPLALQALKEAKVPFVDSFKINNEAFVLQTVLDDGDTDSQLLRKIGWKRGMDAFGKLFDRIDTLQTKSLTLTMEVLLEREQLQIYVKAIQPMIQAGLSKLEQLKQEIEIVKEKEKEMSEFLDFEYKAKVTKYKKVADTKYIHYNCTRCPYTCREAYYSTYLGRVGRQFYLKYLGGQYFRKPMKNKQCTVCPCKCSESDHKEQKFKIVWYQQEEVQTYQGLKEKYVDAQSTKTEKEQILCGLQKEFRDVQLKLNELLDDVRKCINKLNEIALQDNSLSQSDYIDMLIQAEESGGKDGWQQRSAALRELKKQQQTLRQAVDEEYSPWVGFQDTLQYMEDKTTEW
eukprot:CAMPEP_0202696130 /NCGR_PEP_ID=MMETSP1385-20130828/9474_1 /ASSEMBLY_ACC=CAM_ASM_000861 /TAXON_ID=933848 /ORGANISM="Elphidium margaritaceum" /LENGTH=643 /DNA_ID=CAMNT_0049352241 /DNA_START=26 /DNA_END=1954 /DNA_ORIENTATION=+